MMVDGEKGPHSQPSMVPVSEDAAPTGLKIPEVNEVIVGELAERGEWIVANIETSSFWPVKAQKVPYRGEIVWILPIMKKCNYSPLCGSMTRV